MVRVLRGLANAGFYGGDPGPGLPFVDIPAPINPGMDFEKFRIELEKEIIDYEKTYLKGDESTYRGENPLSRIDPKRDKNLIELQLLYKDFYGRQFDVARIPEIILIDGGFTRIAYKEFPKATTEFLMANSFLAYRDAFAIDDEVDPYNEITLSWDPKLVEIPKHQDFEGNFFKETIEIVDYQVRLAPFDFNNQYVEEAVKQALYGIVASGETYGLDLIGTLVRVGNKNHDKHFSSDVFEVFAQTSSPSYSELGTELYHYGMNAIRGSQELFEYYGWDDEIGYAKQHIPVSWTSEGLSTSNLVADAQVNHLDEILRTSEVEALSGGEFFVDVGSNGHSKQADGPSSASNNTTRIEIETAGEFGSKIGSELAKIFFDDSSALDQAGRIFTSVAFGELAEHAASYGTDVAAAYEFSAGDVLTGSIEAGVTAVGNLAGTEIGHSLADSIGFNAEIGELVGGVFGSAFVQHVGAHVAFELGIEAFGVEKMFLENGEFIGLSAPKDFTTTLQNAGAGAVGSYLGTKLATTIFDDYDPKGQAIGGAVGGFAAFAIAKAFSIGTGPAGWAATAALYFATAFFGTSIGGFLGGKQSVGPGASSVVRFRDEHFLVEGWGENNGGDLELVIGMGQKAADILNIFAAKVGGQIANGRAIDYGFGHDRNGVFWGDGTWGIEHWDFPHSSSVQQMVHDGTLDALKSLLIEGGDIYVKRALYRSEATTLEELDKDLTAAWDWSFHRKDADTFATLLANGGQEAADRWAESQSRAADLQLDVAAIAGEDASIYEVTRAGWLAAYEEEQRAKRRQRPRRGRSDGSRRKLKINTKKVVAKMRQARRENPVAAPPVSLKGTVRLVVTPRVRTLVCPAAAQPVSPKATASSVAMARAAIRAAMWAKGRMAACPLCSTLTATAWSWCTTTIRVHDLR